MVVVGGGVVVVVVRLVEVVSSVVDVMSAPSVVPPHATLMKTKETIRARRERRIDFTPLQRMALEAEY